MPGIAARFDVRVLSSDGLGGRAHLSAGNAEARSYLLGRLKSHAAGANAAATGDDAYLQPFPEGVNIVGIIPGTDLPEEYVLVGAHYDGVATCRTSDPADTICNAATDNAAGAAAVLSIARHFAAHPARRSVVVALWDHEEIGLAGSRHYAANPLVPLASTVGYINFDILGANLLPGLRNTSFAIAAESGGSSLNDTVRDAIDASSLDAELLSAIFGQGRSDHVAFLQAGVPTVFFTDATGPCYHTAHDEYEIVDFGKLDQQIAIATAVAVQLADDVTRPPFVTAPVATYEDAVTLDTLLDRAAGDVPRFSPADQAIIQQVHTTVSDIVGRGPGAFTNTDLTNMLIGASQVVTVLTHGPCDGFLE